MSETRQTPYEAHLAALWQQGHREIAVSFLKRAIGADMTLEQLAHALQFPQVREFLHTVDLRDVLTPTRAAATTPSNAAESVIAARRPQKKPRRRRRGAAEVQDLKKAVLARLQAALASVSASQLCELLNKGGHEVDLLQMNRLLSALETEGAVTSTSGKPKGWRLKPQGRTSPAPLIIRKAAATVAQVVQPQASP
jgi:ribosomal protein L12E/L44/L45/RPP1/RPP2